MSARPTSIKRKLIATIMSISLTAVVLACAGFVTYELIKFRQALVRGFVTRAELVGVSAAAALAFDNPEDATTVLASLQSDDRNAVAALYDRHGKLFARYPATAAVEDFPPQPPAYAYRWEDRAFVIFWPVLKDDRVWGTVYLKYRTTQLQDRYWYYLWLSLGILVVTTVVSFGMAAWLQRRLVEPIRSLAHMAQTVGEHKDFSLRAKKLSHDEVGLLTESFNGMLDEIQRRDQEVRRSEAETRAILNSALDAIISMDAAGKIVEFNPAAERMFGYTRAQAVGAVLAELIIPPALREQHLLRLAHASQTGVGTILGKDLETQAVRADATEFPVEFTLTRTAHGDAARFTVFIHDISERRKAEEATRLLAAIVDSSEDAILSKTLDGIITSWNKGAERLYGYPAAEACGQSVLMTIAPAQHAEERQLLELLKQGAPVEHRETLRRRRDGTEICVSLTASPIRDRHGTIVGISSIARDISEAKKAQAEIQRLNTALEQRVRERTAELEAANEELEAFSYSVSHDLRTPLRGINGFSRSLLEDYGDKLDAEGQRQLSRLRLSVERMNLLIDALLKLSRVTRVELRREPVALSNIAHHIVGELQHSQPDRRVTFVIQEGLTATGDPDLLTAVLDNLLRNAWKYTAKHATARIEFGQQRDGAAAVYFVRDDGAGFDMEHAGLLFVPFQRLHRQADFEGTGVGLATVHRIIRRHGGKIWAEGKVEQGATFYFTI